MSYLERIRSYITQHEDEAIDLLCTLAQIPAPSNQEQARAQFCKDWLTAQGAQGVRIDEAWNVIYPMGIEDDRPIAVFAAHSDVVFPDTAPLPLRIHDGKIHCPGAGDNTANVAALLMTVKFLLQQDLKPENTGILFVINSGEEGLGNLKGVRRIMEDFGTRIREFIALDAFNCRGVDHAVGSRRFCIEVTTQGGHSYNDFGRENAIAVLADLITRLYRIPLPKEGKTTFNVGTVRGGTSVNTIAQSASMLYEFRSDALSSLQQMQTHFDAVMEGAKSDGAQITCTLVGDRPCAGEVDPQHMQSLRCRANAASLRHFGQPIEFSSGSTDCNIPLFYGVPAICVGCCFAQGAHTREEYVLLDSVKPGLGFCLDLVLSYF